MNSLLLYLFHKNLFRNSLEWESNLRKVSTILSYMSMMSMMRYEVYDEFSFFQFQRILF